MNANIHSSSGSVRAWAHIFGNIDHGLRREFRRNVLEKAVGLDGNTVLEDIDRAFAGIAEDLVVLFGADQRLSSRCVKGKHISFGIQDLTPIAHAPCGNVVRNDESRLLSLLGRVLFPTGCSGSWLRSIYVLWPAWFTVLAITLLVVQFELLIWARDVTVKAIVQLMSVALLVASLVYRQSVWFRYRVERLPAFAHRWQHSRQIFRELRIDDGGITHFEVASYIAVCPSCGSGMSVDLERLTGRRLLVARCDKDAVAHCFELDRGTMRLRDVDQMGRR